MTVVDIAILAVVALSSFVGVLRGLVREALSLCVWVAAGFCAAAFDERVAPWFSGVIASQQVRLVAGFALVFIVAVFVGGLITNMVSKLTSAVGLGGADSALGMLFGLLRGVLLVMVLVVISIRFDMFRVWYANSILVPHLLELAEYFAKLVGLDPTLIYPRTSIAPV